MRIIPVIDIRHGDVVHATGGDRSQYVTLESDLCPTGEPLPYAYALRERFNCTEVYVADLDAIAGGSFDADMIQGLVELELNPWVDAGVRDAHDAMLVRQCGASVVVGSESIAGPEAWERVLRAVDGRHLAFSLDLRGGKPVAPGWTDTDPAKLLEQIFALAREVAADAPARLYVIDLERVGGNGGLGTEALLENCVHLYPECDVYAGGGIRGPEDIKRLERIGVAGALVSSAIQNGKLQPVTKV